MFSLGEILLSTGQMIVAGFCWDRILDEMDALFPLLAARQRSWFGHGTGPFGNVTRPCRLLDRAWRPAVRTNVFIALLWPGWTRGTSLAASGRRRILSVIRMHIEACDILFWLVSFPSAHFQRLTDRCSESLPAARPHFL